MDSENSLRFVSLCDGDCLSSADGTEKDGKLYITVKLSSGSDCSVNGKPALQKDGLFEVTLPLDFGENILTAKNADRQTSIKVYRPKKARGYGRISSDDNIIFLWDINKNKDVYTSIFDNPYLAVYKKAHDLYGACAHLNIYYRMPENCVGFEDVREDFDLSMMTDKFKDEWIANSNWLKLNFHANQDKPDKPYIATDYQTIFEDCKKVQKEIIRFAGEQTLSAETTVHWGECTKEGVRALRDCGIKCLAGYFTLYKDAPFVSYFYPKYFVEHLEDRDFWFDTELDVFYGKIDFVLNTSEVKNNLIPLLDELKTQSTRCGYVEVMIHEQYFYKDYSHYIPHFEALITDSAKWMYENGYKPAFLSEIE